MHLPNINKISLVRGHSHPGTCTFTVASQWEGGINTWLEADWVGVGVRFFPSLTFRMNYCITCHGCFAKCSAKNLK